MVSNSGKARNSVRSPLDSCSYIDTVSVTSLCILGGYQTVVGAQICYLTNYDLPSTSVDIKYSYGSSTENDLYMMLVGLQWGK